MKKKKQNRKTQAEEDVEAMHQNCAIRPFAPLLLVVPTHEIAIAPSHLVSSPFHPTATFALHPTAARAPRCFNPLLLMKKWKKIGGQLG